MLLNVMKMWALFSYHVCMYEIHVKWYMTCDMNLYMSMNVCQDMKCMCDVWKKHGYAWLWLCMHDSWIEITARSSSVNNLWKCMAYDLMKGTVNCPLATDVGSIVLGTYHWGCRWYCLLGSITEIVGVLIDGSVLPRLKGSYRVVGHPNDRLKSHDWWLYHGHKRNVPFGAVV